MVRQLGVPSFYLTLSCVDLRWDELVSIISKLNLGGMNIGIQLSEEVHLQLVIPLIIGIKLSQELHLQIVIPLIIGIKLSEELHLQLVIPLIIGIKLSQELHLQLLIPLIIGIKCFAKKRKY